MTEIVRIELERRDGVGTNASRRLRRKGKVPVVLYGHGREAQAFATDSHLLHKLLHTATQVVELDLGGEVETALIRDVQYDTYGVDVLHVDFQRVDVTERVEVEVALEFRGHPKGAGSGGVLEKQMDEVTLEISALEIPDAIVVDVSGLDVDEAIHLEDLQIPEGAELVGDPQQVVCVVTVPRAAEEETAEEAAEEGAEPEVVGGEERKEAPDDGGES